MYPVMKCVLRKCLFDSVVSVWCTAYGHVNFLDCTVRYFTKYFSEPTAQQSEDSLPNPRHHPHHNLQLALLQ